MLGFMAATGEPIMCMIIFATKDLDPAWVLGMDPFVPWIVEPDDIKGNTGTGKVHPMGPECNFHGRKIPTFCCCTENGSITAELLMEMLKTIDNQHVFDRSDGIPPFLLLDGHSSRFNLTFLEYINDMEKTGQSGMFVLEYLMVHPTGRLEIVQNKMVVLRCTQGQRHHCFRQKAMQDLPSPLRKPISSKL